MDKMIVIQIDAGGWRVPYTDLTLHELLEFLPAFVAELHQQHDKEHVSLNEDESPAMPTPLQ